MKEKTKRNQTWKARIGAIGENQVVSKLLQEGWDAFNANCTIKNYKSIDIVCLNSDLKESEELWWKPKCSLVQVKTSVEKNIPTGFTIGQCLDKNILESMVKGPYVFVYAQLVNDEYTFHYYIISRRQFIDLLYESHQWYKYLWNREKDIKDSSPACLSTKWLSGVGEHETDKNEKFINPLQGVSTENCWDNIWKD